MAETKKIHVKKGDTVVVISGTDAGKKAKVLIAMPSEQKVLVEGIHMATKHKKPNNKNQQGGIIHQESPLSSSKVMLYCDKCEKGVRVGHKLLADNKKIRVCAKCGFEFDK